MKKIFMTAFCLGLLGSSAYATDYTDVIDLDLIETAADLEGITLVNYDDNEYRSTWDLPIDEALTDSGIKYRVSLIQKKQNAFTFKYGGSVTDTENTSGLFVKQIKVTYVDDDYNNSYTNGYFQQAAFSFGSYGNIQTTGSEFVSCNYDNKVATIVPMGGFTFGAVKLAEDQLVSKIEITWSTEAPVPDVVTPRMNISQAIEGLTPAGSIVNIYCDTPGVTFHYMVTKNGETVQSGEGQLSNPDYYWTAYTFALEGNLDDELVISAYCSKEGWNNSETVSLTATITLPGLRALQMNGWGFEPVIGNVLSLINPNRNSEGENIGTIHYTVNGGEEQTTTDGNLEITLIGNVGDSFTFSGYITEEGYVTSQTTNWDYVLQTNELNAPVFSLKSGEVRNGAVVSISAQDAYKGAGFRYRINGGEWTESTDIWNTTITVTEDCTIEAQTIAQTTGEYSFYVDSAITTATYTIEQLTENEIEVVASDYGQMSWTSKTVACNNVDFFYYGNTTEDSQTEVTYFNMYNLWFCLGNTSPVTGGIQAVKLDWISSGSNARVYFCNEEVASGYWNGKKTPDQESIDNMLELSYAENNGQWVYLNGTANAGKPYILIINDGTSGILSLSRVVVSTNSSVGVQTVDAAKKLDGIFNMNGMAVDSERLTPGLYIVVKEGNVSKILVK